MTPREQKVFQETRLRNLKRRYSYVIQHPEQKEEAIRLHTEIQRLENLLAMT